jgi:ribosomal protein L11 methyltransferase
MQVLRLEVDTTETDLVVAELYEAGVLGITETVVAEGRVRLDAFLPNLPMARALADQFASANPILEEADTRDWVTHSRAMWQPVAVGDRFFLAPEWMPDAELPEGRILLPMPAGQGFGSGAHESTQLALSALEHTAVEGCQILDVGTGSGILLHACRLLGAESLVGCDTDPVAVESAHAYLSSQQVRHALYLGSIEAVRPRRFHLVLANLNATLILNLLDDLFAALRPHGRLILSGILREEQDAIHRALASFPGVTRIYHSALGDWVNFRVTTSVH